MNKTLIKKNQLNNKGFSLIELIVVIAIMMVLVGVASFGIGMLSGKNAQKACAKMMTNLERTRTISMGKSNVSLNFYVTDSGIYTKETVNGVVGDPVLLGPQDVTCSCKVGSTVYNLAAGDSLTIVFDRSDGSLKSIYDEKNTAYLYLAGTTSSNNIDFTFTKASKSYNLIIVPATGRVSK
ncbi:MAG: prepilin-type N-terminal cleavage/methylation domain-containing protein [Lachnospiraceae bacterium]|nr:prepilin-type N-terminal cleavage/methylation domain-containing protein [Lachnospiraceae bacterium]